MKRIFCLFALILAVTTISCKKEVTPTVIDIATIRGVVTDSVSSEVLSDVKIEIGELGLTQTTSDEGEFAFVDASAGLYKVIFSKTGYDTLTEWFTFYSGRIDTLDFSMVYQDTVVVTEALNVDLAGGEFSVWLKDEASLVSAPSWAQLTGVTRGIFDSYIYNFTSEAYSGEDFGRYGEIVFSDVATNAQDTVDISQGNVMYYTCSESPSESAILDEMKAMFGTYFSKTLTDFHLYGTLNEADLIALGALGCFEELDLYNTTVVGDITVRRSNKLIIQDGNAIPYNFTNGFDAGLSNYKENKVLRKITLPAAVTTISERAFLYCSALESISSDVVEHIGVDAFRLCKSLVDVDFPSALVIDQKAFLDCASLESVDFPLVTLVSEYSFKNCTSLEAVDFPLATSVLGNAFYDCSALTSVNFPVLTSVGSASFYQCVSLDAPEFPLAQTVGDYAFYGCTAFSEIKLPSVVSLGQGALRSCDALTTVNFATLETLGAEAFQNCTSIVSLDLPLVSSVGSYSFAGCSALADISLPLVSSLGSYSFSGCSGLTGLELAASATITLCDMVFANFDHSSDAVLTIGATNQAFVDGKVFTDTDDNTTTFSQIVIK